MQKIFNSVLLLIKYIKITKNFMIEYLIMWFYHEKLRKYMLLVIIH